MLPLTMCWPLPACLLLLQELELMIYNWLPYFTLKDSVMDPSYDGPDMWCVPGGGLPGWCWMAWDGS